MNELIKVLEKASVELGHLTQPPWCAYTHVVAEVRDEVRRALEKQKELAKFMFGAPVHEDEHGVFIERPTEPSDGDRLDWLERNMLNLSNARIVHSVYMDGKMIRLQADNENRGSGAGPSRLEIRARTIREATDEAMNWKSDA